MDTENRETTSTTVALWLFVPEAMSPNVSPYVSEHARTEYISSNQREMIEVSMWRFFIPLYYPGLRPPSRSDWS